MSYPEMVAKKWADMPEEQRKIHIPLVQDKRNQSLTLANKLTSNNTYYKHNKVDIKKDRNQKVVCPLCGETTSKGNYTKHKMTILCKKLYEKNKEIEELNKYNKILLTKLNRKTKKPLK